MRLSVRVKLAAVVVAAVVIFTYLRSRSSSPRYAYTPPRLTEQQAWAAFKSSLEQYKDLHKGGVHGEHAQVWSRENADNDVQFEDVQRSRGPAVQNRVCFPSGANV